MRTVFDIVLDLIAAAFLIEALARRDWAASVMFGALFVRGLVDSFERVERAPKRSAEVVSMTLVKRMRERGKAGRA